MAISSSSVETMTSENCPDSKAVPTTLARIGTPKKGRMFLRGIRSEPPRAGIIATLLAKIGPDRSSRSNRHLEFDGLL